MATHSRPPSQARSPVDQGQLGPDFPQPPLSLAKSASNKLSASCGINQEVCTNAKNISQAVNVIKDGLAQLQQLWAPTPLKIENPCGQGNSQGCTQSQAYCKAQPFLGAQPPSSPQGPQGATPLPIQSIPLLVLPFRTSSSSPHSSSSAAPSHSGAAPAPSTVKVDHPDAFKGKIGLEAKQWLTCMLAWQLGLGHPHLDQLGSHCALIQTVDEFKTKFLAAFGNPDATRAAEQKITSLTQTSTCAKYITKFCTLQMELNWNDAALCGQFARGLHWEVQRQIATRERQPQTLRELQDAALIIDNALCKERASHPQQGNKSGKSSTTPNQGQVPANRPPKLVPSPPIPTMSWRKNAIAAAQKVSVYPKEDKGKAKETAKIGNDSKYQSGKRPPGWKDLEESSPNLPFDGKRMMETFLICNTGSHAAILGIKWLEAHNPEIDWNLCTLSFPHSLPENIAIAEEEEADKNPLKGVPSKYHQYAKVFGEEEFNKLPPHRHYNIGIKLMEEGPLNSPLYSMTDAKSATLKDWLRDKLKAGKICPSKSSISSPVMFVPKKDGSHCLVLCGAKVFTKLDLQWGYNNIQVKEGDKWKTAFCTKYSLYKSLVMTFGLTNAPTAFQHFMNKLFKDLLDVCVIIYLDDILVYSKDDTTHTQHVHKVLQRLMENQLFCKASNLDKLKIQAVQEWPTPTKVKEVQLFLGFANFLQQFVANFSHMARPLHNLVKKDMPWKWDTKEQEAFQGFKGRHYQRSSTLSRKPRQTLFLETDASGAALAPY
ncbi:hypothetical protein RHS01_11081 [Rhizoctonia solani]|uniref:Uncharacterized protein n=1 Tax=Rhizoctonia solani TaxID=456999 RepID=A0A8H7LZX8_9AGAM|nr:hypothetical protein RHS01_11081 [Rhizoctonia solani]